MPATNSTLTAICTCQYPDDCCPACYAKAKQQLQERLWATMIETARIQSEAAELEKRYSYHKRCT